MQKTIGAIWAESENGVIGDGKDLLWYLPEDLKHFSTVTSNSTVIMGRKTWESLPEKFRPLPNRENIVITRQPIELSNATVCHSIEEALELASLDNIWFIGGGEIYRQSMSYVERIEITQVDLIVEGATQAPQIPEKFNSVDEKEWLTSRTGLRYKFQTLTS